MHDVAFVAQGFGGRFEFVGLTAVEHDGRTGLGQPAGNRQTDAC